MDNFDNGGYAFPIPNADFQTFAPKTVEEYRRVQSGMTLRDYFAAKFAVVYIGNCYSHPALDAYKMADKMLEARNMSTEEIEAYEKKLAEDMGDDIPW